MQTVKVVAITKPILDEINTADEFITYTARVSNPSNQLNTETAPRLLNYLKENKHWSPFEMVHCVMEINTTRDIARQILRHRSFSFQEFSQRYANVSTFGDDMFSFKEARIQDLKNRQNSITTDDLKLKETWLAMQQKVVELTGALYTQALELGIAKEQARAVLPEGLTKSRLYMAGSLRSWIHYCDLRRANGTQKEHMEVAEACWQELLKHFPSLQDE